MSKVYETAIKIGATISKAFKSDALGAAASLTKLTGAAKQLQSAEKAAGAVKKLNDAVSKSKAKYDQASAALRKLEAAEKTAGTATKESTAWRKAGEKEVARYAHEMDRATKAAEKNAAAMRSIPHLRYEASRERLFGARKGATPLVEKAGSQISGLARDVAILGTVATGAGAAMAGLVYKTLKAGDEIGDTAEKLGVGSTALQELRYGAKQSGDEMGYIDKALGKMLITVGKFKAAKGKGGGGAGGLIPGLSLLGEHGGDGAQAADPFKRIGLNAKKLASLKPEDQLKKIADGLLTLKTQSDRAAVSAAIFGKGAREIDPFLKEGSAGIDKMSKAAHKFGGVMSVEAVKAADQADKAMKDAEMAFAGVSNTLGAALLPTATRVFKEFSAWVASNRGEIQKWATNIAAWIENKGIPAIMRIGSEVKSFGEKVVWLVGGAAKLVGGFGNLAIAVAALRLAPLVKTLGQIGIEGFKAAAAIFKYAAATRAAKLAEGASGVGEGVVGGIVKKVAGLGLGAVAAPVLAVAAGVGAIVAVDAHQKKKTLETEARVNAEQAKYKAEHPDEKYFNRPDLQGRFKATLRHGGVQTFGGGNQITVAPTVHIGAGSSRGDVSKGMDQAKQKVLSDYDARTSFSE